MKALWPDSFVEEGNLAVTVSLLRKALGDERGHQQYIETVSKSGYRFIAPVENLADHSEVGPPQVENPDEKHPALAVASSISGRRLPAARFQVPREAQLGGSSLWPRPWLSPPCSLHVL